MQRFRGLMSLAVLLTVAVAAAGCSSSKSSSSKTPLTTASKHPPPSDPMARARAAGLVPETAERLEYHVHAHLDMFENGSAVIVPGGIGIDTTNPAVHSGMQDGEPAYGGVTTPCDRPCISPLHTHDATGVLHTESATVKKNTFGQFLTEWNVTLPAGTKVYVNGKEFTGDPKTIPLANLTELAVVIGTPPASIPSSYPGF
jgi:hypothetical protein